MGCRYCIVYTTQYILVKVWIFIPGGYYYTSLHYISLGEVKSVT